MAARCVRLPLVFALTLAAASYCAAAAIGQEFRIETEVYVGDEEAPASHTVTLFESSAVYEFIDKPEQIVVYREGGEDRPAQFILLDPQLRRRTDVDVRRIEKLMKTLNRWASEHKDPLLQFAANPKFDEVFDADTRSLTLSSPEWTYRVATIEAADRPTLARYREFTDRFAELSSMLHNSPPPGPRLALNAALEKHGVVPVEIQRTTGGEDQNAVRATHLFSWRLSREDRGRLDEAQAFLANFKKVDNEQFIAARAEKDEEVIRGQSR